MHARLEKAILFRRHKTRAQDGTQWPTAKYESALLLLGFQLRLGSCRQVVAQEIMITLNGFTKKHIGPSTTPFILPAIKKQAWIWVGGRGAPERAPTPPPPPPRPYTDYEDGSLS